MTPRVFLSPDEARLAQLPGNQGEVFRALHDLGAHLVSDEPEPWRLRQPTKHKAREVVK